MPKGPLFPSELTATQWSTQADKADFGNTLLYFIDADFKRTLFTTKLYNRLSMTFGHIAHTNLWGFWEEWFVEEADRVRFIEHLLRWPCYGDPTFTFSDVERALQREVQRQNYLCRFQSIADVALRAKEVAVLEKLQAKYRRTQTAADIPSNGSSRIVPHAESPLIQHSEPIQGTLF
jgi:hypothetical protein